MARISLKKKYFLIIFVIVIAVGLTTGFFLIRNKNKPIQLAEKETLPSFKIASIKENEIKIYFGDRIKNFQTNFLENSNRIKIIKFDLDQAQIQIDYDIEMQQTIYIAYSFEQNPVEEQIAYQIIGLEKSLMPTPTNSSSVTAVWQNIDQIKPYYQLTIFYTADAKIKKAILAKKEAEGENAQEIYTGKIINNHNLEEIFASEENPEASAASSRQTE